MSTNRFPLTEYQDATDEVKAIYDDILQFHRFVPNWYKSQASNTLILRGNWEKVKATLFQGQVPLILKQMILFSISRAKGCKYCEAIHSYSLNTLSSELNGGVQFPLSDDLQSPLIPNSYKVAVEVITRIALNPLSTSNEDFETLSEEGFSGPEIQELIGQADLANFINTFADISGIALDREIAELI